MSIETINPANGKIIQSYQELTRNELDRAISETHSAYIEWSKTTFSQRSQNMKKAAEVLLTDKDEYAQLMAMEMGKPISAGRKEIEKCAWVCEHYAENAERYLQDQIIESEMSKSKVVYRPLGIVFAIMPWNFPFWQVFRFAAPTLMAGNAGLLKHARISTGSGIAIEKVFEKAGFPKDLFRALVIGNDLAQVTIQNPNVIAVTLTGSDRAGKIVGAEAAGSLKKIVLELGGSDPYVVLNDADLDLTAETCVLSRMNNTGQVCIAAKRIIATESTMSALQQKIIEKLKKYKMDDPLKDETNFGPMAREDLRAEVHKQVMESVKKGAKLVLGGEIPSGKGFYYPPTVLTEVKKGMPAYEDEIFGPVMIFITVKDENEAIQVANDTRYGLGAAVFTQDVKRGEEIATNQIQAGACFVNSLVSSDPRLPFGGIKQSGYGRELSGEGIREFVNTKTVCIK